MAATRKLGNIVAGKSVFFCCDMQEKFRPAIQYFSDIVTCASRLLQAAKILDIPVIATEQYSKGLGKTVTELDISHAVGVYDKTKFSMVLPEVEEKMKELCAGDVRHVVLFGIETHVCIQQTVIDLLERGIEVHIVADACSSRSQMDRQFAYERFRAMGVTVTTSEAILLQLVGDKNHAKFKEIQGLIKTSAPVSGLVKL
ncbi:isochorismatase domain-containing protein 1-like [Ruditapes philippinarum]|uniref:isochorismatase domain-containing protein 1-like n=1 Tax=Ruditapes philippinarum TaxID=129788 RepID=UPI00295B599F|nr:isochorismatase domain-containing protein 1-like [Ruditapes philippinarum]